MKIKEIMSKEVKFVDPNTSLQEAAKIMREKDIGILPIGENERIVGMLTDRDIVIRTLANGKDVKSTTVKEVMTPKCLYCFEEDTIEDVSKSMSQSQIRRMPVLNKEKRLVGIISLGDLACKGSKQVAGDALQSISQKTR